ncbi:flagellar hook-basal body complex protein FliE [Methylicorpusculum oleiharenae]|uniref:flagellar hook-basal body complex protein FliE n=1 Tax=Methylicorpusculum oleiharenae TaxID=1338687 RepID=UPI001356C767|nr:flagellar hook-basal body complex protein FliE [Methylicorpusculum oleiharenae]MCD2453065.1 flagellar hook-basal body complex protein FliE [Methylicorpusculum oleiharenae]
MSDMNITQVLSQMRSMSIEAGNKPSEIQKAGQPDFASLLKQSINSVNDAQATSNQMATAFETGESDASLAEVMISMQKASVSFQAMVQVRNKLVDAYKDVMNMPM